MSAMYADSSLEDKKYVFRDRFEAGRLLGEFMASDYEAQPKSIVLAIPAGGVPVGIELSKRLRLSFDCLIVRKIQIPGNTEAGFGALASGGQVFLNRELINSLGLSQEQINTQTRKVEQELAARERLFRKNKPQLDLSGLRVIVTDDGLASGFTMLAAIDAARRKGAQEVVVAVPTAPLHSIRQVEQKADVVYSLHVQQSGPFAVANAYQHWHDLSREEVVHLLDEYQN
ncbi:MAG: phosphoribosyltransferase [Thermodesulfobacteriota bacterium]